MSNIVTEHLSKGSSCVDTLKEQINNGTYDHLFKGKSDLVFLDIGANIGLVSIYAAPYCKHIVAVEPSPEVFPVLQAMTRDYQIIECANVALHPIDMTCQFFINDINSTASSTVNTYGELTGVEGRRLTTMLRNFALEHVDVCKIDAEGAEGESLSFGELEAAMPIIKQYYIEFHNCPKTDWQHKIGTTVGNLARLGYYKMSIDGMALTATRV